MGLYSALSVGRTALSAYQAGLQVAGQNIANVGTPGYTRIRAQLAALPGEATRAGQMGYGVKVLAIRRAISESLQARLRNAGSDQQATLAERNTLDRVESIFDPLGDSNLGTLINEFFSSLNDLQNTSENSATRGIVVNTAIALTQRIRGVRTELLNIREELNNDILTSVGRADELLTQIAHLNKEITAAEAGSTGPAAALRDQRDQLLGELAEMFEITTKEQPNGAVNVYIGGTAIIQFGQSFGLKADYEPVPSGLPTVVVRVRINNGPVDIRSGRIHGFINSRDSHVQSQFDRLDTLARSIIGEINRVHAGGQGLLDFSTLTGLSRITDSTVALNTPDNGIEFLPQTGSFYINVKDASGVVTKFQINVNLDGLNGDDTTLDSLVADINANVPGVTATILPNGTLQLSAAAGSTFTFSDDTSGVLAALGLNTFFTGSGSIDIDINPLVSGNPSYIAAAQTYFVGDGSNATAMVNVHDQALTALGGVSLNDYYNATMANLAVTSSSVRGANEAADIIFESLSAQRESISGVNLDEEAINLMTYQRAYEGAARYMRVVDEMLQVLLTLVR